MAEGKKRRFGALPGVGAAIAVAAGAVATYVSIDAGSNTASAACAAAAPRAAALDAYAFGHMAAFRIFTTPVDMRDLAFQGPDGQDMSVADLAGETLLLNLWATWCTPCRAEMPALDALAVANADAAFRVVPVSVDTIDMPARPREWLATEIQPQALQLYLDLGYAILPKIRQRGMLGGVPTTMLIDDSGCALGVIEGEADWAAPEAQALIDAALAG